MWNRVRPRIFPLSPRVALGAIVLAAIAVAPLAAASAPLPSAEAERMALEYLRAHATGMGLTQEDVADVAVTDIVPSRHNGVTHVYLAQRYRGIEVAGARMTVNIRPGGGVLEVGHRLQTDLASRVQDAPASLSAADALSRAMGELGSRVSPTGGDPQAKLVYQPVAGGGLRLAWELAIDAQGTDGFSGNMIVDARNGQILARRSWKSDLVPGTAAASAQVGPGGDSANPQSVLSPDSYQVFAIPKESPYDGPRTVVANPAALGGAASPFGWHDTNGAAGPEFNITQGNCAHAYTDADNNNVPDPGSEPAGGAGNDYLFALDLTQDPSAYRPAAVTNAFYCVNICHDVLWNYGFDEPAGNFQLNNYGRGGLGNDAMFVEVQDGAGVNNGNTTVGLDGVSPRMQLYKFTATTPARDAALDNGVIADLYFFGAARHLVGGPSADCLNPAESAGMRWGWADFFDLVLTAVPSDLGSTPRGIGAYLQGQVSTGPGVRMKPYSTDISVNNLVYMNISGQVAQNVGAVWGIMLWEVYWELVNAHGFNPDIYGDWWSGGNNLALQLIVDGMKMVPCSPGFVDGRNAILAADQALTGGANRCAIWRAFARRGLGVSASQGLVLSVNDGTMSFDLPVDCQTTGVEDGPLGFDHALVVRPNPFGPQTRLSFALAAPSRVAIEIFDLHGRRVRRIDADHRASGPQEIGWDGRGEDGRPLASGEYVVRLLIDGQTAATKKAMRIR